MRTLLCTAFVFAGSIMLSSADVVAKSHEEVGIQTAAAMTEMMNNMAKITDKASANAFAATVPATKEKLKALLKAAQALPAPTDADKAAVNKTMDDAQEKAAPAMMQMMMGLAENPDAQAIGEIIGQIMQDKEMEEVSSSLEQLYAQEEEEAAPKPLIE